MSDYKDTYGRASSSYSYQDNNIDGLYRSTYDHSYPTDPFSASKPSNIPNAYSTNGIPSLIR